LSPLLPILPARVHERRRDCLALALEQLEPPRPLDRQGLLLVAVIIKEDFTAATNENAN
jgi:hypothetical protein